MFQMRVLLLKPLDLLSGLDSEFDRLAEVGPPRGSKHHPDEYSGIVYDRQDRTSRILPSFFAQMARFYPRERFHPPKRVKD
jgi:hypothetical protein